MKKVKIVSMVMAIILAMSLVLTGCGSKKEQTAEQITNELKDKVSTVGKVVVYTEDTDLNHLLGKDKQYTSKATFEDTTIEQLDEEEPTGGTVEVFKNASDAKARKEYLDSFASTPMFVEQSFLYDNVLIRLNKSVKSETVEKYKTAMSEILG